MLKQHSTICRNKTKFHNNNRYSKDNFLKHEAQFARGMMGDNIQITTDYIQPNLGGFGEGNAGKAFFPLWAINPHLPGARPSPLL